MLWPYLVLLVEVLVFYRRVLFGPYLIPWDLQYYHLPLAWFASRSLGRGELPLWDPFTYCGMPVYANLTTQLFYPPTTLIYLVSNWWGDGRHLLYLLELQIAAHVLLGGVFALLLLRRLGTGTAAALVGATVYQLGAYFTSQAQHLGAIDTAAWLPLAWLATMELAERAAARWLAVLAGALALAFLAGFPAAAAVVYGSTLLLAVTLAAARRARWTLPVWCGGACVLALAVSAVQLLPTMELSRLSVASLRADFLESGGGIPPRALLTLLAPNRFGVLQYDAGSWKLPWNPTFLFVYCGIPALLCALTALWRRSRLGIVFAVMTVAGALWMMGDGTPAYRALFLVLPARLKAALYAEFALCAFTLGLAVLAGLGAQEWLGKRGRWAQAALIAATALDLTLWGSGRPFNTVDARKEPGITHDHYDRFPEIPARMRQLVNETVPPWRIDTMQGSLNWSGSANLLEVPTANGDDPFALIRYMQVRESFTGGERWGRYYEVRDPDSPVLKLLNVRYVISNGELASPGRLVKRENLPGNVVWENADPLPRFFLVGRVRRVSGMDAAVSALRSPGFDVRTECVVEAAAPLAEAGGTVRTVRYGPREIVLETTAQGRSFLVTSEAWYPGWQAWIDDRGQPLLLTNAAFRGMEIPAGRHRVVMRFDPPILQRAAWISVAALVLLGAAVRWGVGSRV